MQVPGAVRRRRAGGKGCEAWGTFGAAWTAAAVGGRTGLAAYSGLREAFRLARLARWAISSSSLAQPMNQ